MLDMFHVERGQIGSSLGEHDAEVCGHLSVGPDLSTKIERAGAGAGAGQDFIPPLPVRSGASSRWLMPKSSRVSREWLG